MYILLIYKLEKSMKAEFLQEGLEMLPLKMLEI